MTAGGLLASSTIPTTSSASSSTFTFNYSSPATLTAGTQYGIVIRLTATRTGTQAWLSSSGDVMAGGRRVTCSTSACSNPTGSNSNSDLVFKAYMKTGFVASGDFVSSAKDANPAAGSASTWGTLSWNATVPGGTTLKFQAAASNNPAGVFSFVGPNGTASTFFTSGASLSQFNGFRYLKYKALFTGTSAASPTLNDVTVCYADIASTSLAVSAATGTYGGTTDPSATLTTGGSGVSGKSVSFTLNGNSVGSAMTNGSGVATLSNVSLSGINAGSYPSGVGASFAGDASYTASNGTNSLTVDPANQTISVGTHAPASATYNTSFTVAATSSSGLAVSYSSSGVCTNNGAVFTMTSGTGTCTVKYDQHGNSNYNAAPQVTESVTASKAGQTITFTLQASEPKATASIALNGTASSGLTVQYTSSATTVATISGSTLNLLRAGSTTVTASQPGDNNHEAATPVDQTIVVTGPIAASDAIIRQANTGSINIPVAALLGNDTRIAADGSTQSDNLVITGVTSGIGNTVTLSNDFVTYAPNDPAASDPLSFTYTVSDGTSTDIGTVTVVTIKLDIVQKSDATYDGNQTSITVAFNGVPNQTYTIQYTTTLVEPNSWISIGQWPTGSTGLFAVTVTAAGDHTAEWNAAMFFRAAQSGP